MSLDSDPNLNVVSGRTDDWQETRELLGGEASEVGVFATGGAEVLNGAQESLGRHEFRIDDIEAVKGDYIVFPQEMVEGIADIRGQSLGPGDRNEANFYVGQSTGVPWFEMKLEEAYEVPGREIPHIHDTAWELYSFHGGDAVLSVADEDYDFSLTEGWDYRDDVSRIEASSGELVAVPPGVPHQVDQQSGNPDLLVAKYSPEGDVGKYSLDGQRLDQWAEQDEEVEMTTYPDALD